MNNKAILLALCMSILLTACGESETKETDAAVTERTTTASTAQTYSETASPTETTTTAASAETTTTETTTSKTTTTTPKPTTTTTATTSQTTTTVSQTTTTTPAPETTTTTTPPTTTAATPPATTTTAAPVTTTTAAATTAATQPVTTTTTAKQPAASSVTAPAAVKFQVSTTNKKTKIKWEAVEGADGYVVWIKRSADGKWERQLETQELSCTLKEPRNKDNSFCVKAYKLDQNGKKVYSEKAHVSAFPYLFKKNGVTYVDGILIVNKTYSLPSSYGSGLTDATMSAFYEMQRAAANDGISLWICSGFRSYAYQDSLYWSYVYRDGSQWSADQYSARAGHSEHQSGLAFDLNFAGMSFNGTREAVWIEKNCYKYGFIIRYPKGKEKYTGYNYESWHCRYVGKELAKTLTESGLTIEEYYGLTSVYS